MPFVGQERQLPPSARPDCVVVSTYLQQHIQTLSVGCRDEVEEIVRVQSFRPRCQSAVVPGRCLRQVTDHLAERLNVSHDQHVVVTDGTVGGGVHWFLGETTRHVRKRATHSA